MHIKTNFPTNPMSLPLAFAYSYSADAVVFGREKGGKA